MSSSDESLYGVDDTKLAVVRTEKAWVENPKYFTKVKISPSATIKMMAHGQSGVEKGIKKNGKPVEIMGMLLGRPATEEANTLIITDAQPLPIEGFETRVIADDESTVNYMIELGEMNELTRKERFCGWYHTHPFDVDIFSNCYLSNTDVSTQLHWQRSEDPHGNPWLAIVIDPLRSLAQNRPEMKAFRVYPPDYSPPSNEAPDGNIITEEKLCVEKFGASWKSYYELEISYFMSNLSQATLSILKNSIMWQNSFTTPSIDSDVQGERVDHLRALISRVNVRLAQSSSSSDQQAVGLTTEFFGHSLTSKKSSSNSFNERDESGANVTRQTAIDLAAQECRCCASQILKLYLFRKHPGPTEAKDSSPFGQETLSLEAPTKAYCNATATAPTWTAPATSKPVAQSMTAPMDIAP